ncbi:unnamed protein product [Brachionus calyciflorus]|uniref:Uncharacterized protein n=1 Tax=Brachionus calyciflorus TaxID=104777 RepID=A0A813MJT3_9BILA|nr:unnamed protein product [Brachionus calyciflorus]
MVHSLKAVFLLVILVIAKNEASVAQTPVSANATGLVFQGNQTNQTNQTMGTMENGLQKMMDNSYEIMASDEMEIDLEYY